MAMAVPSFAFGNGFAAKTPQDVARNRAVYNALLTGGTKPVSLGTGLTAVGEAIVARLANERANEGETNGLARAQQEFTAAQSGNDPAALSTAMADPWVQENKGMAATIGALQARELDKSDPAYQADLAYKLAQTDALKAKPAVTPTDDMRELSQINTERAAAGKDPVSMEDFLASKKGQGLQVTTNPDGTTTVSMGGPGGKPLTEAQGKDVYFINQGTDALPTLDKLGDTLTSITEGGALGNTPVVGNFLKSSDYQQAEQAGRQFLNSILRKESGAAINETEDARYGNTYLPRPGDKPAVLEQKKKARANALLGIKMGLPATAILAMQQAGVDFGALAKEAATGSDAPLPSSSIAPPSAVPTPDAPAKVTNDTEYDALPPGTPFVGPDGKKRVKPGAVPVPSQKVTM